MKIPNAFTVYDPRVCPVPESGCWLWIGFVSAEGYGIAKVVTNGTRRTRRAHRMTWEAQRGPIPDGMVIDHMCRVRSCVNPDHLRVVTRGQNVIENSNSRQAINARKVVCPKCGGPYTLFVEEYGTRGMCEVRRCVPCNRARHRKVNIVARGAKGEG